MSSRLILRSHRPRGRERIKLSKGGAPRGGVPVIMIANSVRWQRVARTALGASTGSLTEIARGEGGGGMVDKFGTLWAALVTKEKTRAGGRDPRLSANTGVMSLGIPQNGDH